MNWNPLIVSLELASITTVLLFLLSLPLAWWLSNSKSVLKPIFESIISLPLVLPPTVLGFYFLLCFSPINFFGKWLQDNLGIQVVFSFTGLVIASLIYSLPFMVHPLLSGLSALPDSLKEASYVLGKSKWTTFFKILLPNIKVSILTGLVLTFAHTIGEFGVVLMIGGNIPGKTKVASIAIFEEVESLNYSTANTYSIVLFVVSFSILLSVYLINGGYLNRSVK